MNDCKLLLWLKINIKIIAKTAVKISGAFFSIFAIVLTFVSWDELGNFPLWQRLLCFPLTIIASILLSLLYVRIVRSRTLWENGSGKITVQYGDLFKIGFPKRKKEERIVVIPVNTHFDTILDERPSGKVSALVSPETNHGRWLKRILKTRSIQELDAEITESLSAVRDLAQIDSQRTRGQKTYYPIGTTAIVSGNNGVTFFLLAIAEFNKNNNAQSDGDLIVEAMRKLVHFYDMNGQGLPIYLPLMGTNLSRAGLSEEESYKKIHSLLELECDKLHGSATIVVYKRERHKVSIWQ